MFTKFARCSHTSSSIFRSVAFGLVLSTAMSNAVFASNTASLDDNTARFSQRSYYVADQAFTVESKHNMLMLRYQGAQNDATFQKLQKLAQNEIRKTAKGRAAATKIEKVWQVHHNGLVAISLDQDLPVETLVKIGEKLAAQTNTRLYPVLSRRTGRAFYDDTLVVTTTAGHMDAVLAKLLPLVDGQIVRNTKVPNTVLVRVGANMAFDAVNASTMLHNLRAQLPELVAAEPNLYRELRTTATVNDPLHASQWHLDRAGSPDVPGEGQIFAHAAWDTTQGDPAVVVAVFDTGTDLTHPDLVTNIVGGFDAAGDDDDASPGCSGSFDGAGEVDSCPPQAPYRESHGTAVSGTIAARGNNDEGLSGVCPNCSLFPVRLIADDAATGIGTAEAFVRAVDAGADVINNSWGPGLSLYFPLSTAEQEAFDHARETGRGGLGTVIVFAAGNASSDVFTDAYASNPYVISVSASTNLDDWALYSNYGNEIDVAAPSLGGTFNEDNFGIGTTDVTGGEGYDGGDYTPSFSGTSAASPVAAGVAGLVLSAHPELTAEQVRLVLTGSADKIRADKVDWLNAIGTDLAAVFDYDATGHSIGFGYGRVNAAQAVVLAGTIGTVGARCDQANCALCSDDNRCLQACSTQDDCISGSVCVDGTCQLPTRSPTDIGAPCNAGCDFCTSTVDSQFGPAEICTTTCETDVDCPTGFDCRLLEAGQPRVCAVGATNAGEPDVIFTCFRGSSIGAAVVVVGDNGQGYCSDLCFTDEQGGCPYGFHCGFASCECTGQGGGGCFSYQCDETAPQGSNWFSPMCFPDPGFGDICTTDDDCATGDYCGADNHCRLDDKDGCDICKPCTDDSECNEREVCLGANNGQGVCTRDCENGAACPGDSVCKPVELRFGTFNLCLSPNTPDDGSRCEASYSCEVACRSDVPCPNGQICNNGTCIDDPTPPDAGTPDEDAGVVDTDAGSFAEGTIVVGGGGIFANCSSMPAESAPVWMSLVGLLGFIRRRARVTRR